MLYNNGSLLNDDFHTEVMQFIYKNRFTLFHSTLSTRLILPAGPRSSVVTQNRPGAAIRIEAESMRTMFIYCRAQLLSNLGIQLVAVLLQVNFFMNKMSKQTNNQ